MYTFGDAYNNVTRDAVAISLEYVVQSFKGYEGTKNSLTAQTLNLLYQLPKHL